MTELAVVLQNGPELIVALVSLVGGAFAADQWTRAKRWRQQDRAREILAKFHGDDALQLAATALDWGAGPLVVPERFRALLPESTFEHDLDLLAEALKAQFNPADYRDGASNAAVNKLARAVIYRRCFDLFIAALCDVEKMIADRQLSAKDISDLGYFVGKIVRHPYRPNQNFFDEFICLYHYEAVYRLGERVIDAHKWSQGEREALLKKLGRQNYPGQEQKEMSTHTDDKGSKANDPGAPLSADELAGDLDTARELANYGVKGRQMFPAQAAITTPTIELDWDLVTKFLTACQTSTPRVGYKLGAKIKNDSDQPGKDFTAVDCSGFVRAVVRRSTEPKVTDFPDGSVVQHDWVIAKKFPTCTVADGKLTDNKIRIAFLSPQDSPDKIGHVALVRNGLTIESHGGVGPNSRPFDGTGWQASAKLYLLKP